MANSEDVVWMACESHLRRFGHVANCAPCLAVTLDYVRAEVRERLKDKARLDWLLGRGAMTVVDGDEIYVDRVQLDAAMGATENG